MFKIRTTVSIRVSLFKCIFSLGVGFLVVGLAGCGPSGPYFSVPETPILSSGQGWAVVIEAYARLRVSPDPDSQESATARRSEIYKVIRSERVNQAGKTGITSNGVIWYKLESDTGAGWVEEGVIMQYKNREQAQVAASRLK